MPSILAHWKDRVYERLVDWRLRLEQARPRSVYTALSAAALWPLVQAAQSEGVLPVAVALGSVAAGVGGNLLAEQIQRWNDQAEGISEADIEAWIATQVAADTEFRQTLDNYSGPRRGHSSDADSPRRHRPPMVYPDLARRTGRHGKPAPLRGPSSRFRRYRSGTRGSGSRSWWRDCKGRCLRQHHRRRRPTWL